MSREVVQDHVDLLGPFRFSNQLFQEGDELGAGVTSSGLALHLAGLYVQRGIERQRPVAIVLEAVPFGPTW